MENENGKKPAYPLASTNYLLPSGLTKREYFAAMAMQAIIQIRGVGSYKLAKDEDIASDAITLADAMLTHLEQREPISNN